MKPSERGDKLALLGGFPIDRESPVPLYSQIKRRLLRVIVDWDEADTRFFTDEELCQAFHVSRMTVRQAVSELVSEGMLRRNRRAGTFVIPHKVDETLTPEMDFIDQWATHGRPLRLEARCVDRRPCPPEPAAQLGIAAGTDIVYVERLRLTGSLPVSIDYRFLPVAVGGDLTAGEVSTNSLLDLIGRHAELDHSDLRIEAGLAGEDDADLLHLMPGEPVLYRALTYFDMSDRPVMAGRSVYRADLVRYAIRMPLRIGADRHTEAGEGWQPEIELIGQRRRAG